MGHGHYLIHELFVDGSAHVGDDLGDGLAADPEVVLERGVSISSDKLPQCDGQLQTRRIVLAELSILPADAGLDPLQYLLKQGRCHPHEVEVGFCVLDPQLPQ